MNIIIIQYHVMIIWCCTMIPQQCFFSLFWSRFSETRAGVMMPPSGLSEYCELLRLICWLESVNHLFVCVWPQEDQGGERVLQKKWTTFLKAQLLCSLPDDGFPFNIIQDVYVLPAQRKKNTLLYAVFTSQWWAKNVERQRKISLKGEDVFH